MIDFLKKLYQKKSNVSDPIQKELWSIAANSRKDESLSDYRRYLCETFNIPEEQIDARYAVYCSQIPNKNGATSWNEDIKDYALSIGITQDTIDKNNNQYSLAMMFRVHVRVLSESLFDPDGYLTIERRDHLEIYISVFNDQLEGLEFKDILSSFKEFEDQLEIYKDSMDESFEDISFEDAISSFLEFESRIDPYIKLYCDELDGFEYKALIAAFNDFEVRLKVYKTLCADKIRGLGYDDILVLFKEFESVVEVYKDKIEGDVNSIDFEDLAKFVLNFEEVRVLGEKEMRSEGTQLEEMPDGFGEFGWEPTNPVPASSIRDGYEYLDNLTTLTSDVSYVRVGSLQVENIPSPVDEYQFYAADGSELCKIYMNSYNARTSTKLPQGFIRRS